MTLNRRAEEAGVPRLAVRAALALSSPDGRSYAQRIAIASGLAVSLDGDLLPRAAGAPRGETQRAADTLAARLGLSEAAVRRDLERGDERGFEKTPLYERVFAYAERLDRRTLPRAVVPRIDLHSPKFTPQADDRMVRQARGRTPSPLPGTHDRRAGRLIPGWPCVADVNESLSTKSTAAPATASGPRSAPRSGS